MKKYDMLNVETYDNGVALITLDKPPLNTLCPKLLWDIKKALKDLEADDSMRAVVLTGCQRAFCAGADVNSWSDLPPGMNGPNAHQTLNAMEYSRLPIIAAIEGHCLGGGLELALSCDIRIASETASIALTEANLGLVAAYGGLTKLPWLIGEARAKIMFYTAKKLNGQEALRYGVVQDVCPPDQLISRALELAGEIAKKAPISVAAVKQVKARFREELFLGGFQREAEIGTMATSSQDFKEGIKAFKEKRPPVWKNK